MRYYRRTVQKFMLLCHVLSTAGGRFSTFYPPLFALYSHAKRDDSMALEISASDAYFAPCIRETTSIQTIKRHNNFTKINSMELNNNQMSTK